MTVHVLSCELLGWWLLCSMALNVQTGVGGMQPGALAAIPLAAQHPAAK